MQVTDVVKLALAIAAGLAGVQALVVAYRRQRDSELDDSRFVNRFESAAHQLGNPEPAVRIAGVQAMAGLADAWLSGRQQCVDVLCAYLRLPLPEDDRFTAAEGQVREAITRAIANRLTTQSKVSWSDLDFDFTGAHIFNLDLSGSLFANDLIFDGTTFHGQVRIRGGCVFLSDVFIQDCRFEGQFLIGDLNAIHRAGQAAIFTRTLRLDRSVFQRGFMLVKPAFEGRVSLIESRIVEMCQILGATFVAPMSFANASVEADQLVFSMCDYRSSAIFNGARVMGSLHLPFSDFRRMADFRFAHIEELQSGGDDVLYGSHIHQPGMVEWGVIPRRTTVPRDPSRSFHHGGDAEDVPTGALIIVDPGDADE